VYSVVELLGKCIDKNNYLTQYLLTGITYLIIHNYCFRVIELVRDFNLKKLVVMKTIYIKSVSTEDIKVETIFLL